MDGKEYQEKVKNLLNEYRSKRKMTYEDLKNAINDPRYTKQMVQNIFSRNKNITLEDVFTISKALNLSLEAVLLPDNQVRKLSVTENSLIDLSVLDSLNSSNEILYKYNPDLQVTQGITCKNPEDAFWFYVFPTNNPAAKQCLQGRLLLREAYDKRGVCYIRAELSLDTGKKDEAGNSICKEYFGNCIVASDTKVCSVILAGIYIDEICMISFLGDVIYNGRLECAVAACSTVSSDFQKRRPTMDKAFITYRALSDEEIKKASIILSVNRANMYVPATAIKESSKFIKAIDRSRAYFRMTGQWLEGNAEYLFENNIGKQFLEELPQMNYVRISMEENRVLHKIICDNNK